MVAGSRLVTGSFHKPSPWLAYLAHVCSRVFLLSLVLGTVFSDAPVSKAYTSISVILQQKLARTDDESWEEQEAAVLLLGTVAEGCITGLCPYLQKVTSDRSIT